MPETGRDPQLLKGVLPLVVLAVLDRDESYGYEIVRALDAAGLDSITTGSVYPVLTRLERDGHVTSRLEPSPSGPARKYYRTSDAGREHLTAQYRDFVELVSVVASTVTPLDTAPVDLRATAGASQPVPATPSGGA